MKTKEIDEEHKLILNKYRQLLRYAKVSDPAKKRKIRKAFNLSMEAHKNMRRRSGELYIFHPLEVAIIATKEIGLGATSIVAALLHDVVEDTEYTLNDIKIMFGDKVARIIDGLTKISGIYEQTSSAQAESIRKILLTLSEDVRVILIKLADRLHNMRTLDAMPVEKKMKIASETEYIYAPLAHRLGLNNIKTELEDLVLKHKHPEAYQQIKSLLSGTESERKKFIQRFIKPLKKKLSQEFEQYKIIYRTKSIASIWRKMQEKGVDFDDIYDLFAVRIIIDSPPEREKSDCWLAYSIITEKYIPKQDRLRDWISVPKANGYESLHITVMSRDGQWVEVQIRTTRMDEIAEKGYAAHYKYKEKGNTDSALDDWLAKIREMIRRPNSDTLDFLDEFKLNLFSHEIYTFTPSGEMKILPRGATVLDFAYAIHSEVGNTAIGAKVNNQLTALNTVLNSGDQVEILTSSKQKPSDQWINWVVTARAKSCLKNSLKDLKKSYLEEGKKVLKEHLATLKKNPTPETISQLHDFFNIQSPVDFYYQLATNSIKFEHIENFFEQEHHNNTSWLKRINIFSRKTKKQASVSELIHEELHKNPELFVLNKDLNDFHFEIAPCCNPIPGDDVIGFVKSDKVIHIHRTSCENATKLMTTFGKGIVKAKWREKGKVEFLTGIRIKGIDRKGLVSDITQIISSNLNVNIRNLTISASDGIFQGEIILYVTDTRHVDKIIAQLKKISNLKEISRISR